MVKINRNQNVLTRVTGTLIAGAVLLLLIPESVFAESFEVCKPFDEVVEVSIGAPEDKTITLTEQPSIAIDIRSLQGTLVDMDILAGFYYVESGQYELTAWMPVMQDAVITTEALEVDVPIPSALASGDYRMVIYVNTNIEQAKSLYYMDLQGYDAYEFTLNNGQSSQLIKTVSVNGDTVAVGSPVTATEKLNHVITISNPYPDQAIRGSLLQYGFQGSVPDQVKIQSMKSNEIKLVPGAENQYQLDLDNLNTGSYLLQAVYLAEDGAQYAASVPVVVEGFPDGTVNAKFTNLVIDNREDGKYLLACIDLHQNGGNTFGDTVDDFMASVRLLDSETGQQVVSVEIIEALELDLVSGKAIALKIPDNAQIFKIEAILIQNGEHVHKTSGEVDCTTSGLSCTPEKFYSDSSPNSDVVKTVVVTIVVATSALLIGTYVAHRRRERSTRKVLLDNDTEI